MMEQATQPQAAGAAASSAFLAGAAWIAEVEPYITSLAGLVAIAAGALSAWYYYERAAKMRNERLGN